MLYLLLVIFGLSLLVLALEILSASGDNWAGYPIAVIVASLAVIILYFAWTTYRDRDDVHPRTVTVTHTSLH
ncbi:MAG: hypothetical protein NUV54_00850 [Candidatus Taylorbacteria bacterium]|nr:hypothetical protein [Candidatus Taylorbacteria bacterium]